MDKAASVLTPAQQRLTQSEATDLFITILSDVHSTKATLIDHLPFIVSKAYAKDVKLLLLESGTMINGQMIRLCLVQTQLGLSFSTKPPMLNGCLNLDHYLKTNLKAKSSKSDAIILTHLIIAEAIEIEALRILIELARNIKPKGVVKRLSVCCTEARQNKKVLKEMLAVHQQTI
ncbi:DUF892 family protein [Mucilaginibacter endophyticus]|uniref:DUF892 family protein n=1 Tax=Mucilaginibacter endophyticus TaxID=2675003 RepID=UPI000E0DF81F|nr:DUF892 family protein [Mucilaginibacter endophyticus]